MSLPNRVDASRDHSESDPSTSDRSNDAGVSHHVAFARALYEKGGPEPDDYAGLELWMNEVADLARSGALTRPQLQAIRDAMADAWSTETIQGFVLTKPHGYARDFELIDRIYREYVAPSAHLERWDLYLNQTPGAQAVRNRAGYLCGAGGGGRDSSTECRERSGAGHAAFLRGSSCPSRPSVVRLCRAGCEGDRSRVSRLRSVSRSH